MGFVFRKRVSLSPRSWLNLSKSGVSASHRRGRVTVNTRGQVTVRLVKGLSYKLKLW